MIPPTTDVRALGEPAALPTSPSRSDRFGAEAAELPPLLADLARRLALLAAAPARPSSRRALVWAAVRWGRWMAEAGDADNAVDEGLELAREIALGAIAERADGLGRTRADRVAGLLEQVRDAARLGLHAEMLIAAGAWDSALQTLLRQQGEWRA
jgi:hypothetical protein